MQGDRRQLGGVSRCHPKILILLLGIIPLILSIRLYVGMSSSYMNMNVPSLIYIANKSMSSITQQQQPPCDHQHLPQVDVIVSITPERHFLLPGFLRMFRSSNYPTCRIRLTVMGDGPPLDPDVLALFGGNAMYVPVVCEEPEEYGIHNENNNFGCYPNVTYNLPWGNIFFNWRDSCTKRSMREEVGVGFQCKTQMGLSVVHAAYRDSWDLILFMDSDDYYPPGYVKGMAMGFHDNQCDIGGPRYEFDVELSFNGTMTDEPKKCEQGPDIMLGHFMTLKASSLHHALLSGCGLYNWQWDNSLSKCMTNLTLPLYGRVERKGNRTSQKCQIELDDEDLMTKSGWQVTLRSMIFSFRLALTKSNPPALICKLVTNTTWN